MNNIDKLRKTKGLTYTEIADKAGLSSMYIHLLAKGERQNPSLKVMQGIAAALGESVEDVFKLNKEVI